MRTQERGIEGCPRRKHMNQSKTDVDPIVTPERLRALYQKAEARIAARGQTTSEQDTWIDLLLAYVANGVFDETLNDGPPNSIRR
jgi:hypothetical protein